MTAKHANNCTPRVARSVPKNRGTLGFRGLRGLGCHLGVSEHRGP